jgi:hypothetical protein
VTASRSEQITDLVQRTTELIAAWEARFRVCSTVHPPHAHRHLNAIVDAAGDT